MMAFVPSIPTRAPAFPHASLPSPRHRTRPRPSSTSLSSTLAALPATQDNTAPAIRITSAGSDGTSRVDVTQAPVPLDLARAAGLRANAALFAELKPLTPTTSAAAAGPEVGANPDAGAVDYYFPATYRNLAPVIDVSSRDAISVSWDTINPSVAGTAANARDSVAFWKNTKTYKWTAPASTTPAEPAPAPATLATAAFERYIPTVRRDVAPAIEIKKPAFDGDTSAYLCVGAERVPLDTAAAAKMGATEEYDAYPVETRSMAPVIAMRRPEGEEEEVVDPAAFVALEMDRVGLDTEAAAKLGATAESD